jgi:hypothetical protein
MKIGTLILLSALVIGISPALAWPGRPAVPPPKAPNLGAPPPAWIEAQARSAWLAFGSYCWKTACVDMIPPSTRPGLPTFVVRRGKVVRVHLGFSAKSIAVSIGKKSLRVTVDATKRIGSWKVTEGGILTVFARAAGDASYVARLRVI